MRRWLPLALVPGLALAQAPPLPRLAGIVVSADARVALFEVHGRIEQAGVGEPVGPFTVQAIGPDSVQLERDGAAVVVGLGRWEAPPPLVDRGGATFGLVVNTQGPPDD